MPSLDAATVTPKTQLEPREAETTEPGYLGDAMFAPLFAGMQIFMIIMYGLFTKYDEHSAADVAVADVEAGEAEITQIYGMYQDVHVMIFIGFGFLMTFLRKYGFGAVSFNLMLAAFAIQWGILVHGFFSKAFEHGDDNFDEKIHLNIEQLVVGDFSAATVLISFGAILGKCSPSQYLVMVIFEVVFEAINFEIGTAKYKAVDIGGTMFIHTFGAYFGLAVTWMVSRPAAFDNKKNSSRYTSDIFSMIGTVFLWIYWPSFVGVLATGNARVRIIIHTVFAIASSCITAFSCSSYLRHKKRFDMVDIQNATLAGGVAIGAVADFTIGAWGAMIVGSLAGIISTVGYVHIQPFLEKKCGILDTCGVHNLHGMPGVLGGLISAIAAVATSQYGDNIGTVMPEVAKDRTQGEQMGIQFAALGTTLIIAVVGGLITGAVMNLVVKPDPTALFSDHQYFEVNDDFHDKPDVADKEEDAAKATAAQAPKSMEKKKF